MKQNKVVSATMAALFAQIIFGFSFMFSKVGLAFASPITLIADRYLVAFIGLSLVMLVTKQKLKIRKEYWKILIMSLFQPVLYYICEIYGIALTTSSFSSVMISFIPVVAMLCGIVFLKEKPSILQYLFALLSVAGVAVMAMTGKEEGAVTNLGILLLFFAVFSSVGYNISSRKISSEFSVFERTYIMTIVGLVSFLSMAIVENIETPMVIFSTFMIPEFLMSVLYLGLISSVVAFLLLNYANTYLPVAKTTGFSNVTTVVSIIAGVIFLNERISLRSGIAIIMILFGVLGVQLLTVQSTPKKSAEI